MVNKSDILSKLKENYRFLAETFKVKKIGLFGSYVRNDQTSESDIDILVEFSAPISLFEYIDLEDYLHSTLGNKVDLVSEKGLKPILKMNILREVVYV